MFTGLIEEVGRVLWIRATEEGTQLRVAAPMLAKNARKGDSIAVNGCCLTVALHRNEELTFDLLAETIARTNLESLRRDSGVNLERALAIGARLGGHIVQGHVDGTAPIIAYEEKGTDYRLEIALPKEAKHYLAEKGSIAVNGISLTVASVQADSFVCWIIPHTRRNTNLQDAQPGNRVNLEFDVLAKYVERMLPAAIASANGSLRPEAGDHRGNGAQ